MLKCNKYSADMRKLLVCQCLRDNDYSADMGKSRLRRGLRKISVILGTAWCARASFAP
jgi:hypothetical protein